MEEKTKQIASIQYKGFRIVIIYNRLTKYNRFKIYKYWSDWNTDGRFVEHKKKLEEYEDFHSCLYYLVKLPNIENM